MKRSKNTYDIKKNITLKNRLNSEMFKGDIVNEENIDGKMFYVLKCNGRFFKFNKDSFTVLFKS